MSKESNNNNEDRGQNAGITVYTVDGNRLDTNTANNNLLETSLIKTTYTMNKDEDDKKPSQANRETT